MGQGHPDGILTAAHSGHWEGSQLTGQGALVSPSQCQTPLSNLPVVPNTTTHPQHSALSGSLKKPVGTQTGLSQDSGRPDSLGTGLSYV